MLRHKLSSPAVGSGARGHAIRNCVRSSSSVRLEAPTIALKEWAVICAALADGEQTILLRKGGIREGHFEVKHKHFWLLPTGFHSQEALVKAEAATRYSEELASEPKQQSSLQLRALAEVTGLWSTSQPDILQRLDPFHVLNPSFLEARLKWRAKAPLTLLELRCFRPDLSYVVPNQKEYWGCFSWTELVKKEGGEELEFSPVISDVEWAEKQHSLRKKLARIEAEPLELPL